VSNS